MGPTMSGIGCLSKPVIWLGYNNSWKNLFFFPNYNFEFFFNFYFLKKAGGKSLLHWSAKLMPFIVNPCRYVRSLPPNQSVSLGPYTVLQPPPFIQYESGFPQLGQLPRAQMPMNYRPSNTIMNPFCAVGPNQTSRDAVYFQWPSPAMMYAHSYDHFRHTVAQVCML